MIASPENKVKNESSRLEPEHCFQIRVLDSVSSVILMEALNLADSGAILERKPRISRQD